jgi:bifunctional non-homologous end joining protein LigD
LKSLPLVTRRELLEKLLKHSPQPLRLSEALTAPAAVVWKEVTRNGLEGLLAKQKHSPYEPGRRTGAWVKIKAQLRQEFVIGGYTSPEGARTHFGALLVGYYQGARLVFASGVGTGFDQATLKTLHDRFQSLRRADCPFANLPTPSEAGRRQGMTAAEMRRCVWLKPELVCEVRFAEWTQDGCLRQPVYLGLRADKKPRQVRREDPA